MEKQPLTDQAIQPRRASTFACGEAALDTYLHMLGMHDVHRRVGKYFVAVEVTTPTIAAFYTLSTAILTMPDLPTPLAKRLLRYPSLPAVRIGSLAVDDRFTKRGLDAAMLADAAQRVCVVADACAMVVDAKNEGAVAFYEHHGFRRFGSVSMPLFLPSRRRTS